MFPLLFINGEIQRDSPSYYLQDLLEEVDEYH
jgi:hypothetical protein